jgi:MSHA biogenesis protein MshP
VRAYRGPYSNVRKQRGISMMVIIFMLILVSVLGVSVQRMSATHHTGSLYTARATQAYYSARSGVEHALESIDAAIDASADPVAACTAFNIALPIQIGGFDVSIVCGASNEFNEGGTPYRIYSLTSTASSANFQIPDVANRRVQVSVKFP